MNCLGSEEAWYVTKRKDGKNNGIQRYSVATQRTSSLGVIAFDRLTRTEHVVRIVNLSVVGVGIESGEPIEPGLACFKEQVGGHKYGVVTWCRPDGDNRYRAGINFTTLPLEQEQYLLNQLKQSPPHKPLQDPEKIIATLLDSVKRHANG
jgi:hypothetical protein